jgi:PAS domain S-box-containing protein
LLDQEFLKNITVLYVEDEKDIRDSMSMVFEKLFKKVVMATNGQDGYDKFRIHHENNLHFDIVISDINMPDMNGLAMIEKIREIDKDIPIVLTTAHSDSEYFLEAINHNVYHYALKPIKVKQLALAIQDATKKYFNSKIIEATQLESKRYLDIINQVAIVVRTDLSATIKFVNDIYCEVSGYTREELIGINQRIVRHEDMPTVFFDTLWNALRAKEVWKGKIKNKAKDGSVYFINATIFPLYDDIGENVIEYMAVGFLITEEEMEKREYQKKVIQNIKESKVTQNELRQKIKDLEHKLNLSDNVNIVFEKLESEKRKSSRLLAQVDHYEKLIEKKVEEHESYIEKMNEQIIAYNEENHKLSEQKGSEKKEFDNLKNETLQQSQEINRLNAYIKEQELKIKDLEDVIKHREAELEISKDKQNS